MFGLLESLQIFMLITRDNILSSYYMDTGKKYKIGLAIYLLRYKIFFKKYSIFVFGSFFIISSFYFPCLLER